MSQETSKSVAVTGVSSLPAFMQQDAKSGKENIDAGDTIVPRVALSQAVSPEVLEGKGESGNFYHTMAEEDLGEELEVIFIHHSKRYTLWNPRHAGGGVLARASDGAHWDADFSGEIAPYKDRPRHKVKISVKQGEAVGRDVGLGKWGSTDPENSDSPPAATLTHVLVAVAPDRLELGPFLILLQRSAEPVAKLLLSKVKLDPAPIYGQKYAMKSKTVPSPSGEFNQYAFVKAGHVEDMALYEECKRQNTFFTDAGVKFDENAAQNDAEGDTGGGRGKVSDDGKGDY